MSFIRKNTDYIIMMSLAFGICMIIGGFAYAIIAIISYWLLYFWFKDEDSQIGAYDHIERKRTADISNLYGAFLAVVMVILSPFVLAISLFFHLATSLFTKVARY